MVKKIFILENRTAPGNKNNLLQKGGQPYGVVLIKGNSDANTIPSLFQHLVPPMLFNKFFY